jgi:thiosulfate/3-mercaptopyruvate sulfurtransferase
LLVDAEWLSQHLTDRDLVILHVGNDGEYRREHISGARLITEEDLSRPHNHSNLKDMMLELPDAAGLRANVSQFGISDTAASSCISGRKDWCSRQPGSSSRSTTSAWAREHLC